MAAAMEVHLSRRRLPPPLTFFCHWEVKVEDRACYIGRPPHWSEGSIWDPANVVKLGTTDKTHAEIDAFMTQERELEYDQFSNNCQHVARRLVQFLEIRASSECGRLPSTTTAGLRGAVGLCAANGGTAWLAGLAGGSSAALLGALFAAPITVAISTLYLVPLASCNAHLQLGAERSNTCQLAHASFLIVTEEGPGHCYYYPYHTMEKALADFDSWRCSRLLFHAVAGGLPPDEYPTEIKQGGFAHAYNTIRRAAAQLVQR